MKKILFYILVMCNTTLFAQDTSFVNYKSKKVLLKCSTEVGNPPLQIEAKVNSSKIILDIYANGQKSNYYFTLDSLLAETKVFDNTTRKYKVKFKSNEENVEVKESEIFIIYQGNKFILHINSPEADNCKLVIEFKEQKKKKK